MRRTFLTIFLGLTCSLPTVASGPAPWVGAFSELTNDVLTQVMTGSVAQRVRNEGAALACGRRALVEASVKRNADALREQIFSAVMEHARFGELDANQAVAAVGSVHLAIGASRATASVTTALLKRPYAEQFETLCGAVERWLSEHNQPQSAL